MKLGISTVKKCEPILLIFGVHMERNLVFLGWEAPWGGWILPLNCPPQRVANLLFVLDNFLKKKKI